MNRDATPVWERLRKAVSVTLLIVLLVGLTNCARASGSTEFSITTNEALQIKARLEAYQAGKLTLLDILGTTNTAETNCEQLIGYYLLHTNDIQTKAKLPVSRCYVAFGEIRRALPLAQEYVKVYSNDVDGWEVLAYCYVAMTNDNQAINAYEVAVKLGDVAAYQALGGEAIRGHRLDVVQKILPKLLDLQRSEKTSQDDRISLTTVLLAYSLIMDREDIFVKTLQVQDLKRLLSDDTIRKRMLRLAVRCFRART